MSTGMNGTTSRGVFQSIASLQAADVDTNTVVWVADGDSYDIKAADGSESFLLNNGRGAFLRADTVVNPNVEWDFEVVFNDGVELRSGYGNRNAHGNKAVDFSRASESGCINKSGVVETVAVDEPCITSGGLEIYEAYINYFAAPQSPVTQVITIPAGTYTLWVLGAGSAATTYGNATEGGEITFTSPGEALTVTISGAVSLCNLIDLNKIAPPILEVSAPSTRSAEPVSVPMMNNMPGDGKPFSIMCDFGGVADGRDHRLISDGSALYLRITGAENNINFGITDNVAPRQISSLFSIESGVRYRVFVVVRPNNESNIYIDGMIVGSTTSIGLPKIRLDRDLYIGSYLGSLNFLNSHIKNLRIFHEALSHEQVAAWGGYNE